MLEATLDVHVDGVVTLTFEVRNAGAGPEPVDFLSAQQHEIEIQAESGAILWRSGADRMFAQVMCTRTLGPGARWTFVERWQPTARGRLRARGWLVSAAHEAECSVSFDVP